MCQGLRGNSNPGAFWEFQQLQKRKRKPEARSLGVQEEGEEAGLGLGQGSEKNEKNVREGAGPKRREAGDWLSERRRGSERPRAGPGRGRLLEGLGGCRVVERDGDVACL